MVTRVTPAAAGEVLFFRELREARGESSLLEAGEDGEVLLVPWSTKSVLK